MKKLPLLLTILALSASVVGCGKEPFDGSSIDPNKIDMTPVNTELKGCFNYFMEGTNFSEASKGYGLTVDRLSDRTVSSIAATGFLLASYPVFVEQGYLTKEDGYNRANKTLDTLLRMQRDTETSYGGCLAHFVMRANGKRYNNSEISTIDTAILVSGAITAGEYFLDEVKNKAETLWGNVDFNLFSTKKNGKDYISMGIDDLTKLEQLSPWDFYAEQLMIYILGAGNPVEEHRIDAKYYKNITKRTGSYGDNSHIYSWFGSLFTYQYSQAFFNFKLYNDENGVNYFTNSVNASKTSYAYSQALKENYKTHHENSWGLTACDTPLGYSGELGSDPRGFQPSGDTYYRILGTIAPTAAIGSLPFTPKESYNALKYYQSLNNLNDAEFGLRDSFNLDFNGVEWYDPDYIGIDKGIEVLQLYNFKNTDFVSNLAMNNKYVIEGFTNNGFVGVNHE